METLILTHDEISLKLDRIAWQILEENYNEPRIRLSKISSITINHTRLDLDKADPLNSDVHIQDSNLIKDTAVILIDDVLNSGTTMAAALKEVLNHSPKSIHTAVLANRDHHKFPLQANFVGISLATTMQEHISYSETNGQMKVVLV